MMSASTRALRHSSKSAFQMSFPSPFCADSFFFPARNFTPSSRSISARRLRTSSKSAECKRRACFCSTRTFPSGLLPDNAESPTIITFPNNSKGHSGFPLRHCVNPPMTPTSFHNTPQSPIPGRRGYSPPFLLKRFSGRGAAFFRPS